MTGLENGSAANGDLANSASMSPAAANTAAADTSVPAIIVAAMSRALELARRGPSRGVNPQVGCVILDPAGTVIAEGWHRGAGTPHAEVAALSELSLEQTRGATVVVTLEPCNHTGRTGPCADALIDAGVAHVYYSVSDPGIDSSQGADRLRTAGIETTAGVAHAAGEALLGDWLTAARLGRPRITLKWAASLDGRAAAADGSSQWITGPAARADVHRRRSEADAIIVGTGTALTDDPTLTARRPDGTLYDSQPIPIVIGERRLPDTAAIFAHPHDPLFYPRHDLTAAVKKMHARGIRSIFIEGGPTLASAFVAAGLVDEYVIYLAPTLIGGPRLGLGDIGVDTITEQRHLRIRSIEQIGVDIVIVAEPARTDTHADAHADARADTPIDSAIDSAPTVQEES